MVKEHLEVCTERVIQTSQLFNMVLLEIVLLSQESMLIPLQFLFRVMVLLMMLLKSLWLKSFTPPLFFVTLLLIMSLKLLK